MIKVVVHSFTLLYTIVMLNGCGKTCVEATYYFNMTERFYPELDSIQVGDTLWVASSHATTFRDTLRDADINYSGSKLGLNMRLIRLNGGTAEDSGAVGAFPSFTTIVITGSALGNDNLPDENKGVHFDESNAMFSLKVAFIPKEKGIYSISLGDAAAVRRNQGCELASVSVKNTNNNNHLYFYQNSRPGYEVSDYEKVHSYFFKVN